MLYRLDRNSWARFRDAVAVIENAVYEPARRDSIEVLEAIVLHPRGVSVVAHELGAVAGFCLGAPLEHFPHVNGVTDDPNWGDGNTLYSADITVVERYRGKGIARRLKAYQLDAARGAGYRFVAGRNRVGYADTMWAINRALGAVEIVYLENDYPDDRTPNDCRYYHIDL